MASVFPDSILIRRVLICAFIGLFSCTSNHEGKEDSRKEQLLSEINQALEKRNEDIEAFYKEGMASGLAERYLAFADSFTTDLKAAEFLFRAAQEYEGGLGQAAKAIELLELLQDRYPNHELIPNALFYKAFIYENSLGELGKARHHYDKLILEYPGNEFAIQAEAAKELLGLSPEEITKLFEAKKKE